MKCIGDKVADINKEAECYRNGECDGCPKCWIMCKGCDNCKDNDKMSRPFEIGDFVIVEKKSIIATSWKHQWRPTMDEAIGRTGYIYAGNQTDGWKIRFNTTNSEVLAGFFFPPNSVAIAAFEEIRTDEFIKNVKEKDEDQNSKVI